MGLHTLVLNYSVLYVNSIVSYLNNFV